MHKREFSIEIGGKTLTATFSDLAERASGSVIVSYGNTSVLATAVMSDSKREGIDYFPLFVDYEERFYAAGEILGSRFIRREGRPTDEAILGGRMVDRTIRPLFDHSLRNEVQIVITILSIDEDDPDILAINAASLALATSDIPWNGPVSAVRIGLPAEETGFVINPTYTERADAALDAVLCGKKGIANMIEVGAKEIDEEKMGEALRKAQEEIVRLQKFQKDIVAEIGKEKRALEKREMPQELKDLFLEKIAPRLPDAIFGTDPNWNHIDLKNEWMELSQETFPEGDAGAIGEYYERRVDEMLHAEALENERRADGRGMDEIRPLFVQAGGISPTLHGVGIFYRGGTHILSILTLGGPKDAQLIDSMEVRESKKHFMHHYNFPPFSSGETGRIGGINRRAVGHGALAEKALAPVIPSQEAFPYTIRIVSEALASNGSTSMGSVCASTLALMDAGVPIMKPVAGIAMGLMLASSPSQTHAEQTQKVAEKTTYKILTDIQGPEDHHGDMDLKVAGTKDGITAVQMDVKVEGVPLSLLEEAFVKARNARRAILEKIKEELPEPRKELSPAAPKIIRVQIRESQIGLVIGPSGGTIKRIVRETGAEVDVLEDGTVFITGKNGMAEKAAEMVEEIVHEFTPGERSLGEVVRILDFGAFVKVSPYAEGLVHISEMAPVRIERVTDLVKEGDRVPVVVKEIDEKGRLNLSIKKADPEFFREKLKNVSPRPAPSSGKRGGTSRNERPPRNNFRRS